MKQDLKQKIIISGIFLIFICYIIWGCWYFYRITRFEFGFEKVKVGDTKESVLNLMGKESEVHQCNVPAREKVHDVKCFEISGYRAIISYWAVAFDENGIVVKTYRWTLDDGYGKPNEIEMLF